MARLSNELQRYFFDEERTAQVTLAEILLLAKERIFGFLLVILSLPSALPVPAPGYSMPFGALIVVLAVQLIFGAEIPWLPQRMLNHPIKLETVQKLLKAGNPWLRRIEAIARPRLSYICTTLPGKVTIGSAIALMGISMIIPIPGTNTIPAIGVFVTSFGLLEDDGAISLGGLVICLIGAISSISILIAVFWGGSSLLDLLKTWLGR
ncbi:MULTISPECIES: exopolysaccharide biosynthesis protein [Cyanophyceae]|uniref:exopolysaccharide biosynthesis protein n=1 Tax=Cyanophyceae TaxID=3028117 RepID=UPI002330B243|nr:MULTISPECIES: exopolysaccharide biosynthesis protein [Cyanophyceae]MDB9357953.1 exopolysaccharide biosynthesis protein [Nodularia spumigena CS-587/03]MDB9321225.1 exopolysaccharide biosynthesis protein [Nodularia spumigena CS-591/07A]MDB9330442.1 exopolysaccharide biosynthesis protein [Nodularia spumigena CS-591/04]MDB9337825.1 exopolysaccharide biosynthesis protein [Nodularia spumigena CS-589/07]MDB9342767.1 exopolysaccharide biosynthesis protein [Nodularia spumigena CS-588/06]